jgi:hypothetical protein
MKELDKSVKENNKWIRGISISTVLGVAAMVVTVVVAVLTVVLIR